MTFYNKKLGLITNHYNSVFSLYILPYQSNLLFFYNSKNRKKVTYSCLLVYPIFYKKIFFFELSCSAIKKKKMKNINNLNQTIILEGSISSNKCIYTIPIFSLSNNIYSE